VYDTEDFADVINLFSSAAAGVISGASMVLKACITFASAYGAFNKNESCFNRCCNCCRCVDTCTKMLDGPLGIVAIITIVDCIWRIRCSEGHLPKGRGHG
jgi:CO dehydrogenase/acetyl-CoA synthase alpha subunit